MMADLLNYPHNLMKQFTDFIPLLLFFITKKFPPHDINIAGYTYTLGGIFSATQILIVSALLIYGAFFIKNKKLDRLQIFTLFFICLFGSSTLYFHNETILKWKAPIFNWLMASVYCINLLISKKTISQLLMDHVFDLTTTSWRKLELCWIGFFVFLGFANFYVAFYLNNYIDWVTFKVFGNVGFTFLFLIGQFFILRHHLKTDEDDKSNNSPAV
jgi:intracellular septation protein